MKSIVFLDSHTLNPGDLNWASIEALGHTQFYPRTATNQVLERAATASILVVNKVVLSKAIIAALPQLECICVSATGYNNVDIEAAKEAGIPVCNVSAYSTPAVAQHVFALLLELCNQVGLHQRSVRAGQWAAAADWCYWEQPLQELWGKTMGIYGYGKIGQQVGRIAQAFGMRVIIKHTRPVEGVERVEEARFFAESDVISLHAPLTSATEGLIDAKRLAEMKPTALLINTGRGGLVIEEDLREALLEGQIAGAALDVLSQEPPPAEHPLIGLETCIITPHQAWASQASRQRLLTGVGANIEAFLAGQPQNVVN